MQRRPRLVRVAGTALAGLGLWAAAPAGAATPVPNASAVSDPPSLSATIGGLPGLIGYASSSNYYGSGGTTTLATVSPDGGGYRVLTSSNRSTFGLLSFSPDGNEVAYFRGNVSKAVIDVMNLTTRAVRTVFTLRGSRSDVVGLAWAPDGKNLVVGGNEEPGTSTVHPATALWSLPLAGGAPKRLTAFDDAGSPAVAPNGDLVFVTSKTYASTTAYERSTLWIARPDGSDPRALVQSSRFIDSPAVSPDGRDIAFSVIKNNSTSHLESVTVTGQDVHNLTAPAPGRSDILPTWSPDGSHIAFLSSRSGRYEGATTNMLLDAYVMTASGTGIRELLGYRGNEKSVDLIAWGS